MLNHVKLRDLINVEVLFRVFWEPLGPHAPKKLPFWSLPGALWESSGHLWETFGDQAAPKAPKSVPNATQRLQGSPKSLRKDDMARLSQEN